MENVYNRKTQKQELLRLNIQQKINEIWEKPIYKKLNFELMSNFKNKDIRILDIGCSDGTKTMYYFGKYNYKEIIGIDFTKSGAKPIIEIANEKWSKQFPNAKFINCDVESNKIKILLDEITNNGSKKFHFINLSFILLHLHNPQKLLNILNNYLVRNGIIYVIDVDNDYCFAYPDKNKYFKHYKEIGELIRTKYITANRYLGKAIPSMLHHSKFRNFIIEKTMMHSFEYDQKDRKELFDVWFSWIKSNFENILETYPNMPQEHIKECKYFLKHYQDMKKEFNSKEFIYTTGLFAVWARK